MVLRKGEVSAAAIDRSWPHQVAVSATECTGSHGRFMDAFCLDLSMCERHHNVFHEDKWWIVYCRMGARREIPHEIWRGTIQPDGPRP
jgi:hypothetical protein